MSPEDFGFVARMLRRRSGLSLSLSKMAHVERRLEPVVRLFDLKDMPSRTRALAAAELAAEPDPDIEQLAAFLRTLALAARLDASVMVDG